MEGNVLNDIIELLEEELDIPALLDQPGVNKNLPLPNLEEVNNMAPLKCLAGSNCAVEIAIVTDDQSIH